MKRIKKIGWLAVVLGILPAALIGSAGSAMAAVPNDNVFPIVGYSATACTYQNFPAHIGTDCFALRGTPLVAVESGTVDCDHTDGLGGNVVRLTGNSGTYYYYAHLDQIKFGCGRVTRNQLVGTVGNTGNAAGKTPHLHLSIAPGGRGTTWVDPYPYLVQWSHPQPPPVMVEKSYYWRGIEAAPTRDGYWLVGRDGGVFSYGSAKFAGSMGGKHLNQPVVDMTAGPSGTGYRLLAKDGGVFAFGGATYNGNAIGKAFDYYTGIASTRSGHGYWIAGAHGGVYSFGDARSYGSMAGKHLNAEIVDIEADPSGNGYWLLGKDGGVFAFGSADYDGNAIGKAYDYYVDIEASKSGHGYWIAGAHGGVYSFGDAHSSGSMAGKPLAAPIQGMAADPDGQGYWLVGGDGGVFGLGANFLGRGRGDL
jgi:hypothetical protein